MPNIKNFGHTASEMSFEIVDDDGRTTDTYLSYKKVQVGKDQEKEQSEKDSHSKNQGGKKTKLTIRYLYHENIS